MLPEKIKENEFIYHMPSPTEVKKTYNEFMLLLSDFALTLKGVGEIQACVPIIARIAVRVDQRKDYYMYFHSEEEKVMHISHEKEMALWAYWVCKYKPIQFKDPADDEYFFNNNGCTVSDAFAAYIVISIVCANNKKKVKYFSEKVVQNLYYDFANRDFSKEAVIAKVSDLIG